MKQQIRTANAPQPIGPYVQANKSGNMIFLSGQIPLDPQGNLAAADIKGQTKQVIENIKAVLEEAGLTLNNVIKTTVFLKDMGDFAAMNEVYGGYFKENPPARSAFQVGKLPLDVLVEIESIAITD